MKSKKPTTAYNTYKASTQTAHAWWSSPPRADNEIEEPYLQKPLIHERLYPVGQENCVCRRCLMHGFWKIDTKRGWMRSRLAFKWNSFVKTYFFSGVLPFVSNSRLLASSCNCSLSSCWCAFRLSSAFISVCNVGKRFGLFTQVYSHHVTWVSSRDLTLVAWPDSRHVTWLSPRDLTLVMWPDSCHVTWLSSRDFTYPRSVFQQFRFSICVS